MWLNIKHTKVGRVNGLFTSVAGKQFWIYFASIAFLSMQFENICWFEWDLFPHQVLLVLQLVKYWFDAHCTCRLFTELISINFDWIKLKLCSKIAKHFLSISKWWFKSAPNYMRLYVLIWFKALALFQQNSYLPPHSFIVLCIALQLAQKFLTIHLLFEVLYTLIATAIV